MRVGLRWGVLSLIAAGHLAAQQESDPGAIAERIVSISSVVGGDGPMWSPDGSRILFASSLGGAGVWGVPSGGGAPSRVTREISTQLVRLSPKGDVLAFLSEKSGNPELWLWDMARGTERRLTNLGARINAMSWSPDGLSIAFSALRYGQFDLWRVGVANGAVTRLTSDPRYETYPSWTTDGQSIVYVRSDDRWADHEIVVIPAIGGVARTIASDRDLFDYGTIGTRARIGYPQISPDGNWVLFKSHRSGWVNYWVAPFRGGAPRPLVAEPVDQSDARYSPDGKSVAFLANRNGTVELRLVAATGGASRNVVAATQGVVGSPEWSPDGTRLAYTFGSVTRPPDLYVVPSAGGTAVQLTTSIPPGTERALIVPEKVNYQSDGHTISAYLYKPSAPGSARLPGIMYIHGGPTGQFFDAYLPQAQFLAQMGYVVLAPNIRGSSGYGKAFEDANNSCWTHCDLRDVLAGVDYLKGLRMVDGGQMGITGISYGGIMTMGAIAHAPGVFQAAVAQSGYSDWISFQDYNTELGHSKLLAYEWGSYPDSAVVYRRNSPIFSADQVTTPVFLLHGVGASQPWRPGVYPIPSSLEFVHALDRLNKVVRYKTYPGETYYVYGRENSKQVLLDMGEFFAEYLR